MGAAGNRRFRLVANHGHVKIGAVPLPALYTGSPLARRASPYYNPTFGRP